MRTTKNCKQLKVNLTKKEYEQNLSEIILYEYIVYRNKMKVSQIKKLMYHVLNN